MIIIKKNVMIDVMLERPRPTSPKKKENAEGGS
jgi:hypothetical protein